MPGTNLYLKYQEQFHINLTKLKQAYMKDSFRQGLNWEVSLQVSSDRIRSVKVSVFLKV